MKIKTLYIPIIALILGCTQSETIDEERLDRIETLMSPYQGKRPGYALGIVKKGELVVNRSYGLSNLDYNIAISDSSRFYIGSMAKQFTAAALLVLESEGAVDFEKPVSEYLPDFPDYGKAITINHLIHHTSGIRETNSLQLFQGIDRKFEEKFSTQELIDIIYRQQALNFNPGDAYLYSSGGYALLAQVIENVSKTPLREFLASRIFQPLGMTDTFVCDDSNEIIPNRVVSYWPKTDNSFERRSLIFNAYGDGGIMTTVNDLVKWDSAFYSDILGVSDFADKMYTTTKLNNGMTIDYARGLNVWNYRGEPVVQHNGGMLGFRVDLVRFPKRRTSIILLGNSAYSDPTGDALKIADMLFDFEEGSKQSTAAEKVQKEAVIQTTDLEALTGSYWTDQTNYWRRITASNDSLFIDSGNQAHKTYLEPRSTDHFVISGTEPEIDLTFESDNRLTLRSGITQRSFRKFDATPPSSIQETDIFMGSYYSEELNSRYTIDKKNGKLFLRINENRPFCIYPPDETTNVVWNGDRMVWIGFAEIKFDWKGNKVEGFHIGDGRVSGVRFVKTN